MMMQARKLEMPALGYVAATAIGLVSIAVAYAVPVH